MFFEPNSQWPPCREHLFGMRPYLDIHGRKTDLFVLKISRDTKENLAAEYFDRRLLAANSRHEANYAVKLRKARKRQAWTSQACGLVRLIGDEY